MSAYVVEDHTINRILAGIEYAKWGHLDYAPWPGGLVGETRQAIVIDTEIDRLTILSPIGYALREINEAAVRARYKDADGRDMIPGPYEYETMPAPSLARLYKSIRCLLYQCTEGDVPETDLYKQLEAWSGEIAHAIAFETKEVQAASWE